MHSEPRQKETMVEDAPASPSVKAVAIAGEERADFRTVFISDASRFMCAAVTVGNRARSCAIWT